MASSDSPRAAEAVSDAVVDATVEASLLWKPVDTHDHQLELLRKHINASKGTDLLNYHDMHKWSVDNYDQFWELLWHFLRIKSSSAPTLPAIDITVHMDKIPKWFPGVSMNYAENLLRYEDDNKIALMYTSERIAEVGIGRKTFGQLRRRVAFVAAALRAHGVVAGDRVVCYMPNCPEALEIMLATSSLGAIWSATSPDFGVSGVLDRFRQIRPKIIFSVESVSYNMRQHDHLAKLKDVVAGLETLEKVVIVPYCKDEANISLEMLSCNQACFFSSFVGSEADDVETPVLKFEQVPFNHPLFIMYSSGTTGAPKCMVHGVGGTLMKHLEEHQIQGNRGPLDVLLQFTTIGWMMYNWMVSALALGTTIVLYDGSPLHPTTSMMWDVCDSCGVTVFGTSAKWICVQEDRGVRPRLTHSLATLKTICSTGSPLPPHAYDYVYRDVKSNVLLASISGGTDIIACFMGENSILPVHRGEIQSAHLGCSMECWSSDEGKAMPPGSGPGELVCSRPFPSMPVCFWNDPEGKLYHAAYFEKFPDAHVWAHGDYFVINPETGGMLMLGRSDGTLNPNGVRFGSAEIYNIVERSFPEVEDSLCVSQKSPADGEERVILFLKTSSEYLNDKGGVCADLEGRIRSLIRQELSARHVPALILPISDIPYTVNGKKVEVAIKHLLAGLEVKNASALRNPECLQLYKNIPETKAW